MQLYHFFPQRKTIVVGSMQLTLRFLIIGHAQIGPIYFCITKIFWIIVSMVEVNLQS